MRHVILQPAGNRGNRAAQEHYEHTIRHPVELATIVRHLDPDDRARLQSGALDDAIATWGVKAGKENINVTAWGRIAPGDIVLFSGDRRIFAMGEIVEKAHAPSLAAALWGTDPDDNSSWEYVYFIDNVEETDIHVSEFSEIAGYENNYNIQGFRVLNDTKSARFLAQYSRFSEMHPVPNAQEKYARLVKKSNIAAGEPTDATGIRKFRKEQQALRSLLFKEYQFATCALCGKSYPVNFLVAAHVKQRAFCDEQERLDWKNIVMPACKFGCDELYEQGYIYVEYGGNIVARENARKTPEMQPYIAALTRKNCSHWSPESEPYFAWHRTQEVKMDWDASKAR
jgi:hypothetical protein